MDRQGTELCFEHFQGVLGILEKCTDDYLFIYDLCLDEYSISQRAVERFNLEKASFPQASDVLKNVCYSEDYEKLMENITGICDGHIAEHNMEYRWVSKQGEPLWISCRGQIVHDDEKKPHYLIGRITELGRKNVIDNVTGLYREMKLCSDLTKIQSFGETMGYLLLIGLDGFREINEKYGKEFGDEVLRSVAGCIRECVNDSDTIYRMNGDEMLVLVKEPKIGQVDPAKELYQQIRRKVDATIFETGYQHFYTISGGSAYYHPDMNNILKLTEQADFALHQAKVNGKNTYVRYDEKEYDVFLSRVDMQERLRNAVKDNFRGFELYYQPIVNVEKKKILGAEALLRWQDEIFGMVSPGVFIPLLEESGLIIPVGRWVIWKALRQCQKWQEQDKDFRVNINLSFIQLKKSNLLRDIEECIDSLQFNSKNVLFEITESGELEENGLAEDVLKNFHNRQLDLAIDDFGTGYSNLRYIKDMMFDLVKIDQSFIRNIQNNQYDYLVVKQFTELAHSLDLKVCYEGVETYENLECVLALQPDYIQGFYFAKPVQQDVFEEQYLCKIIKL